MQAESQLPKAVGEMDIKGTNDNERLIYAWENTEVLVTPRKTRPVPSEEVSKWQQARYVETTPVRALRKMKRKVKE